VKLSTGRSDLENRPFRLKVSIQKPFKQAVSDSGTSAERFGGRYSSGFEVNILFHVGAIMSAPKVQHKERGFSLVELLIVVIILSILAAIVVPQFSSATTDAQDAALDSNLSTVRAAIELYKVQHANAYPSSKAASGGSCPTGATAGTGAIDTAQAMTDQLTMYTDSQGRACSLSDSTYRFGPYLRKGVPADPVTQTSAVVVQNTGAVIAVAAGTTTGGWVFDNKTGQFVMNHAGNDAKGKAYSTH
jgi:prepilin-type N-terminal cleavage/methylation domain-containing protein